MNFSRVVRRCSYVLAVLSLSFLCSSGLQSQPRIILEQMQIDTMPALHSGVVVERNGLWLFIGGRTNGLHAFQGAGLFAQYTQNRFIYVVDPILRSVRSVSTGSLPPALREQLTSSNMEWSVRGSRLWIFGGYGYTAADDDWKTFASAIVVNIDSLIDAVQHAALTPGLFRQVRDERFALCGGAAELHAGDDRVSLVFGHRFDGMYNKDTIGEFVQHYSYGRRMFRLDPLSLAIEAYTVATDSSEGRRRDYNLVPHFDGSTQFSVAYSGVFRASVNMPYTTAMEVRDTGLTRVQQFNQRFAQYECAVVPVWDAEHSTQRDYFIGGMALWYKSGTEVVYDSLVPFVNTISCVQRDAAGQYREELIDTMALYMGTNARFIPDKNALIDGSDAVVRSPRDEKLFVGYVVGGIVSPKHNISSVDPQVSNASNAVYKVFLDNRSTAVHESDVHEDALSVYQCSTDGELMLNIQSSHAHEFTTEIVTLDGRVCATLPQIRCTEGTQSIIVSPRSCPTGFYHLRLRSPELTLTSRFILIR